jgi:hypothetical protein
MPFRPIPVLTIGLLFLAGCAGSPAAPAGEGEGIDEPAAFTDATGAIQGVVVDDAINPIANAQVGLLEANATTRTAVDGGFSFSNLAPGRYSVFAAALGHESKGTSVEVQAGQATTTRITLATVAIVEPYPETYTFGGLIECGWGITGAGTGNCLPIQFIIDAFDLPNPTNTRTTGQYEVADPSKARQGVFEMMWDPSAATTASELRLLVEAEDAGAVGGTQYGDVDGTSPLRVVTDETPFEDLDPASGNTKVQTRTFPAARTPPTYVVNQRFTVFATVCYNAACPDDFTVVPDA